MRKSPSSIEPLPAIQLRLLRAVWPLLAPGGRLVYASCTTVRRENAGVLTAFLAEAPDARVVPAELWEGWPGIGVADEYGRQILPGEAGADGFYYAALKKQ
jgi:16S rRNA (cytosine967-C5)-methyltransferase